MTTFFPLLTPPVHASPPLLDVDWTLFVQLGIFLLLYAGLSRFVFAPYLAMRRDRADRIDGSRIEAERCDAKAGAKMAEYDDQIATAKLTAAAGRAERRRLGEATAAAHLAATRKQTEATLEDARAKIAASAPAAALALRMRADELARSVAIKVLGRQI